MELPPSQPGLAFSSADLQRAYVGPDEIGRILLRYAAQAPVPGSAIDMTSVLLAAILKTQAYGSVRYIVSAFTSGNPGGAFLGPPRIQQVLLENPLRRSLILARIEGGGLDNKPYFIFESNSLAPIDLADTDFDAKLKYALPSTLTSTNGTGVFPFFPCPSNPVTVMTDRDSFAVAIIIEGI